MSAPVPMGAPAEAILTGIDYRAGMRVSLAVVEAGEASRSSMHWADAIRIAASLSALAQSCAEALGIAPEDVQAMQDEVDQITDDVRKQVRAEVRARRAAQS